MAKILVNCAHGAEDPERAVLPFIVGNVACSADQEAVVFLTVEGVRLATHGYADSVKKEGFQSAGEVISAFIANGGEAWVCATCAKPRGITESDLIPGATIKTAAKLVEYLASGASAINVS